MVAAHGLKVTSPDAPAGESPLTILHVIDSGGLYGAERMLLALGTECVKRGHRVIVGSMSSPAGTPDVLLQHAEIAGLETAALDLRGGRSLAGGQAILQCAREAHADVIHSHGYKPNVLLALVPRKRRPAVVSTLHGWTSAGRLGKLAAYEFLERQLLPRLDCVVTVSEAMRGRLQGRVPAGSLLTIPNGIVPARARDRPRPRPAATVSRDGTRSRPVILCIGRLSHEKGFDVLVHAVRLLRDRGRDVEAVVAGEGPERLALQHLIDELGVHQHVRLLGYVDDIGALHDEASVLAIPSRSEGLPIVLLEAMDAGLPVVATGVGEIPAVLEQGRLGSLVPAGSPGELASALWPLLDGGPTVTERADLARDSVRTKYSAAGMARQYCSLYAAVARQGCSG